MEEKVRPAHRRLWSGLAEDDPRAEVGILGIPFDNATSFRKGAAFAPVRIRSLTPHLAPYSEEGKPISLRVRDYGDVYRDLDWDRYFARVEERARAVLAHPFALFLGGDHSVTIPVTATFAEVISGRLGYLHLDAHLDLADEFEGHPWSHACTARRVLEQPGFAPARTVFVGVRSFMKDELAYLAAYPEIEVRPARELHRRGPEELAAETVARLSGADAVYVTLDIDVLDPSCAPGTGTPEAGGLTTRGLLEFLRPIFTDLPVRAMDVVEVSPPLDRSDITAFAALKVIYEVLGWVEGRS